MADLQTQPQWKRLKVITVNVIIWLILSDWKRPGRAI